MTETNIKGNPVLNFLWTNRNPMQKTANAGIATGLVLGAAGAPFALLGASVFALPILYNVKTEFKGGKKVGMCLAAGAMSMFTLALGGAVGNAITGREFQDSASVTTPSVSTPASEPTAESVTAPVQRTQTSREINSDNCTSITGLTLEQAQQKLGEGKLVSATGASEYMPAIRMYNFGNAAFGGACSAMVQNGKVETATFIQF